MRFFVIITLILFQVVLICQIAVLANDDIPKTKVTSSHNTGTVESSKNSPDDPAKKHESLGTILPLWSVIPFVGILLSIALFPLLAPHIWHHHYPKILAFWALAFAVPFVIGFRNEALYEILHIYIIDYIPFIILLWSLYTIAGGIYINGTLKGTPAVNTLILAIGTIIASLIGTTGASMILIRPILRSNIWRAKKVHTVIFFIFLVSNIGGALTPLGDPPLFLGFLHGVPFFWTLYILPHMLFASVILLVLYFIIDTYYFRKEKLAQSEKDIKQSIKIEGSHNFIFLALVIAGVLFSGLAKIGEVNIFGIHQSVQNLIRDLLLIVIAILSLKTTAASVRKDNGFTWAPIKEVAYLFAGIFMTIIPALAILKAGEQGAFTMIIKATEKPAHYFWSTGILSSFLDNAPTYLSFFYSAIGKFYPGMTEAEAVSKLVVEKVPYLAAISAGAVFMGANTYIGNAPNFMVKSIAEETGVKMPSFFGYMFKYSIPILLVIFALITLIFFL